MRTDNDGVVSDDTHYIYNIIYITYIYNIYIISIYIYNIYIYNVY